MEASISKEQTETVSQKPSGLREKTAKAWVVLCLILTPTIANANAIENGVEWVLDLLTNGIARSLAIIAIVVLGYLAWAGRITGGGAAMFIVGIILVFGGAGLVDLIIAAVS